jgi:hypothetical protein
MKKQFINEVFRMQELAGILNEKEIGKGSFSKADVSDLYDNVLDIDNIDINLLDNNLEKIVNQVGLTPEQKALIINNKLFTSSENHPEFDKLTERQVKALILYLKSVLEKQSL